MKRRLIQLSVMAVLVLGCFVFQALPAPASDPLPLPETGFCTKCEADCYQHAENIEDYNACVFLCNYAGDCKIPTR